MATNQNTPEAIAAKKAAIAKKLLPIDNLIQILDYLLIKAKPKDANIGDLLIGYVTAINKNDAASLTIFNNTTEILLAAIFYDNHKWFRGRGFSNYSYIRDLSNAETRAILTLLKSALESK